MSAVSFGALAACSGSGVSTLPNYKELSFNQITALPVEKLLELIGVTGAADHTRNEFFGTASRRQRTKDADPVNPPTPPGEGGCDVQDTCNQDGADVTVHGSLPQGGSFTAESTNNFTGYSGSANFQGQNFFSPIYTGIQGLAACKASALPVNSFPYASAISIIANTIRANLAEYSVQVAAAAGEELAGTLSIVEFIGVLIATLSVGQFAALLVAAGLTLAIVVGLVLCYQHG